MSQLLSDRYRWLLWLVRDDRSLAALRCLVPGHTCRPGHLGLASITGMERVWHEFSSGMRKLLRNYNLVSDVN